MRLHERLNLTMNTELSKTLSKVPEVTLLFWIIKIAATTLGETGGDAVSMSMHLGYLTATGIFAALFARVAVKIRRKWAVADDAPAPAKSYGEMRHEPAE